MNQSNGVKILSLPDSQIVENEREARRHLDNNQYSTKVVLSSFIQTLKRESHHSIWLVLLQDQKWSLIRAAVSAEIVGDLSCLNMFSKSFQYSWGKK